MFTDGAYPEPHTWLSDVFGYPCFRVSPCFFDARKLGGQSPAPNPVPGFYWGRITTGIVSTKLHEWLDEGFNLIDVSVTLQRPPGLFETNPWRTGGKDVVPITVGFPQLSDVADLAGLAEQAWRCSRFNLDPKVTAEQAAAVKRAWISSYVTNQREGMLLSAILDGKKVAVLCVAKKPEFFTIELLAVKPEYQGRGIAKELLKMLFRWTKDRPVTVGTQAANVDAIRFYEDCGFRTQKLEYVLHLHRSQVT